MQFPFPEFIHEYGYEDSIFIENLRLNSVLITHIENYLIHHNSESNIDFIKKSERAVNNLHDLIHFNKVDAKKIRLSNLNTI